MDSLLDINNLSFNNSKITIILDDKDEPWFKAKDVATVLEYGDTRQAVRVNVDEDDRKTLESLGAYSIPPPSHNEKNTIYINEPGLYSLILSSKKEEAKKFKKWITSIVLPSIRKHGEYKLKQSLELKEKEIESITNISLKLKQITLKRNIEPLKRNQYIYIASTNLYSKQNYFKVGGTITKIKTSNQRLSGYNTGRPYEDYYFYFYVKECNNYKIIEDKLNIYLKNFKPNDKKEMYNILLEDLVNLIETLIKNNNREVEYMNTILPKIYNNLIDNELGEDVEPIINDMEDVESEEDESEDEIEEIDIENPIITFVKERTRKSLNGKINKRLLHELFILEHGIEKDLREFNKIIRDEFKLREKHSDKNYYWIGISLIDK